MKKTNAKSQKLVVSKESIRSLTDTSLGNAVGGTSTLSDCISVCSTKGMPTFYAGCPKGTASK